jgi:hypothetical protein
MRTPTKVRTALAALLGLIACAPSGGRRTAAALEQGRTYTTWLYGNQYGKLWERLTPEMRQVFGSASELGAFAGRAVTQLGRERGVADERVAEIQRDKVYSRTASFVGAHKPVTIEWTLTPEGAVSGLLVRPAEPHADPLAAESDRRDSAETGRRPER